MARHGMAICKQGTRHTFFPPQATCDKQLAAAPQIIKARTEWLKKTGLSGN